MTETGSALAITTGGNLPKVHSGVVIILLENLHQSSLLTKVLSLYLNPHNGPLYPSLQVYHRSPRLKQIALPMAIEVNNACSFLWPLFLTFSGLDTTTLSSTYWTPTHFFPPSLKTTSLLNLSPNTLQWVNPTFPKAWIQPNYIKFTLHNLLGSLLVTHFYARL